jgi:PIN domain nuclease of toxin-antitoxin system
VKRAFLDSQVALWLAQGKLEQQTLNAINSSGQTLISAITIAELEMKASLGKLPLPPNLVELFQDHGITVESFDAEAASQLGRFPQLNRHDPFDRMILAQASKRFGTSFYTADETLISLELDWVVAC